MGDEKSSSSIVMASRDREPRDRELLIPVADSGDEDASSKPFSSSSSSHHTGREADSLDERTQDKPSSSATNTRPKEDGAGVRLQN